MLLFDNQVANIKPFHEMNKFIIKFLTESPHFVVIRAHFSHRNCHLHFIESREAGLKQQGTELFF